LFVCLFVLFSYAKGKSGPISINTEKQKKKKREKKKRKEKRNK